MLKRRLRRGEAGYLLVGVFVFQLVEAEGERFAQAHCFVDRFGAVAEQPRHLFRRLEMALGIGGEQAACAADCSLLADAGQHIGKRPAVGMMHVHVIDGDQRHAGVARLLGKAPEPRTVVTAIEHGRSEAHAAGGGVLQTRKKPLSYPKHGVLPPPQGGRGR
jgi:hypothetical protein